MRLQRSPLLLRAPETRSSSTCRRAPTPLRVTGRQNPADRTAQARYPQSRPNSAAAESLWELVRFVVGALCAECEYDLSHAWRELRTSDEGQLDGRSTYFSSVPAE